MKKMLALLLALVMVLSLAACASSQPAAASTETAETTETTEPAAEESAGYRFINGQKTPPLSEMDRTRKTGQ